MTAPGLHIVTKSDVREAESIPLDEVQAMVFDQTDVLATDGCVVDPDGSCSHGRPSVLLALGII